MGTGSQLDLSLFVLTDVCQLLSINKFELRMQPNGLHSGCLTYWVVGWFQDFVELLMLTSRIFKLRSSTAPQAMQVALVDTPVANLSIAENCEVGSQIKFVCKASQPSQPPAHDHDSTDDEAHLVFWVI